MGGKSPRVVQTQPGIRQINPHRGGQQALEHQAQTFAGNFLNAFNPQPETFNFFGTEFPNPNRGGNPQAGNTFLNPANPFSNFANTGLSGQAFGDIRSRLQGFSPASARAGNILGTFGRFSDQIEDVNRPIFERNLQAQTGVLSAAAPSVRSSAFGNQAIDLATRAGDEFSRLVQEGALNASGQQAALQTQASIANQQAQTAQLGQLLSGLGQTGAAGDQAFQQRFINPSTQLLGSILGAGLGQEPNTIVPNVVTGLPGQPSPFASALGVGVSKAVPGK